MRGSHRQQIFRRSGARTPNIQIVPTLGSKVYREYLSSHPSESQTPEFLKDQMTLKSRGPIPIYYESRYGKWTLNPFRVHFVLKVKEYTSNWYWGSHFNSRLEGYSWDKGAMELGPHESTNGHTWVSKVCRRIALYRFWAMSLLSFEVLGIGISV